VAAAFYAAAWSSPSLLAAFSLYGSLASIINLTNQYFLGMQVYLFRLIFQP
jgi:hypothetical protein